jgi:glutamate racemase
LPSDPEYSKHPIGVFDSGIGGLSVLKALRADMPHEHFIYIADSGHAPYGERDVAHVLARSRAIVQHLVGQNVKALVIACNTATAAAIHLLRLEHPGLALIGVEPALKPAMALSRTGRIGVMATRSTLTSAKFQALLAAQAGQADFVLQPCDGLADAIERSAETGDTAETIALCTRYTQAMGVFGTEKGQIDTLVLGCTHYPFASAHLRVLLGSEVQIIDNGEAIARQTRRLLHTAENHDDNPASSAPGQVSLFTTGQPQTLQAAAKRWLGLSDPVKTLLI